MFSLWKHIRQQRKNSSPPSSSVSCSSEQSDKISSSASLCWEATHPFTRGPTSQSLRSRFARDGPGGIAGLVFKSPLFYLIKTPKLKTSDAGDSYMPSRSHKVLLYGEKMKLFALMRKEKTSYAEVAKIYSRNKSSLLKL